MTISQSKFVIHSVNANQHACENHGAPVNHKHNANQLSVVNQEINEYHGCSVNQKYEETHLLFVNHKKVLFNPYKICKPKA